MNNGRTKDIDFPPTLEGMRKSMMEAIRYTKRDLRRGACANKDKLAATITQWELWLKEVNKAIKAMRKLEMESR